MRESRLSGSVEGVMSDHDSYSDCGVPPSGERKRERLIQISLLFAGLTQHGATLPSSGARLKLREAG
jgi:hypothetical protein